MIIIVLCSTLLFNSSVHPTCAINDIFIRSYCDVVDDNNHVVTSSEVHSIISRMACGEAADHPGLQLEHYCYASFNYFIILSVCISSMFCHGYMPIGAAHSVIYPFIKDTSGNISDSANYRPIALVTIFSKILEHIIIARI